MKKLLLALFTLAFINLFSQNQQWDSIFVSSNSVDNIVYASVSTDSSVFVGGKFINSAGQQVNYIAMWDSLGWHLVNTDLNAEVYALCIWDNKLVAGGAFTSAGATSLNYLGVFDGNSWSALGTGANDTVYALYAKDEFLYIGGKFTSINANASNRIAQYSSTAGWTYYSDGPNGTVYAINAGTDLFVGGIFSDCGGVSVSNVAYYSAGAWNDMAGGVNDTVFALESYLGNIVAGGAFTQAGSSLNETACASWDGTQWNSVGNGFNNTVYTLKEYNGILYAGGKFTMQPYKPALHIARLDGAGWGNLGDGTNGNVYTITGLKRDVFAGGDFTQAGNKDSYYFARWGAKPKFLTQASDGEFCIHDTIRLEVSTQSSVPVTYQWYLNGNPITDSVNTSLTISDASASWSGIYTCVATNRFGETSTSDINITINTPASIISQIPDTASCMGNYIGLYVNTTGTNNTFHWFKNGSQLNYATDSLLGIFNVSDSDTGYYYCVVSNYCATQTSDSIHLTVNPLPSVSFLGLESSYCSSDPADTLQGIPEGGTFSGQGISGNVFSPYGLSGNFIITYEYTDTNGCSNINNQQTSVTYVTPVSIFGLDSAYCLGSLPDTLQGVPSGGTFSGNGMTDSIFIPSNAGAGIHEITYQKNINGCVVSFSASTEVQSPEITLGNDTVVCNGSPFTLTIQGSEGNYSWNTGDTTQSITVIPTGDTTFTAYVETSASCRDTASINLSVFGTAVNVHIDSLQAFYCNYSEIDTLTASPLGGTFSGTGVSGNTFNPQMAGTGTHNIIYVYTDSNSCQYYDTAVAVVGEASPGNVGFVGLDMEYCHSAEAVTLTGIPQGGVFSGTGVSGNTFNPQQTPSEGIYFVTYSLPDSNSCGSYYTQPVRILPNPTFNVSGDTTVCKGQTLTVSAWGNGTFEWSTGDTGSAISYVINYPRTYTVTFTDSANCKNTDSIYVGLRSGVPPGLGDTAVCKHTLFTVPDGYVSYNWFDLGIESQTLMLDESGSYRIKVTDSLGCYSIDTLIVTVKPTPRIDLEDSYEIYRDQTIILGLDNTYDYYQWSDGSGDYLREFYGDSLQLGDNIFWVKTAIGDCEAVDTTNIYVFDAINVEYVNGNQGIGIYPNPAKDFIVLSSKNNLKGIAVIYDIDGKKIKQVQIKSINNEVKINVGDLPDGSYYIVVNKMIGKFIKQ